MGTVRWASGAWKGECLKPLPVFEIPRGMGAGKAAGAGAALGMASAPPRGAQVDLRLPRVPLPWNAIYCLLAIATWLYTQPELGRMAEFRVDWVAQIYVRNLCSCCCLRADYT